MSPPPPPPTRQITAILPAARKPGRFELVVDGEAPPHCIVSIESIERLKLVVGGPLDAAADADLRREAAVLATYDRALSMLALRARSSTELRRQLVRKGEPEPQVLLALERLTSAGFLDDASFARQFARSKALGAGLSRRRLREELGRRGVAAAISDAAIQDVFTEEEIDEQSQVEQAARRKLRTLGTLDRATQRRRLYAYLARRGYDADDIARVVREMTGASSQTEAAVEGEPIGG